MLRLGQIDYLNVRPVYHTLLNHLQGEVKVLRGVPTALNQALMAGEIDVAPISAIEAARHADELVILPGLSIASLGAVRTVLLFAWEADPQDLDGSTIVLTDHSATSVALLKVLCKYYFEIEVEYVTRPQKLEEMLGEGEAALVIGDTALIEAVRHRAFQKRGMGANLAARPYIFDLGDEWLKWQRLPFVFALWAARRDRLDAVMQSNLPDALHSALLEGLAAIPEIAADYAPRLDVDPGSCRKYLRDLRYGLGEDYLAGLHRYLSFVIPGWKPERLVFLETNQDKGGASCN